MLENKKESFSPMSLDGVNKAVKVLILSDVLITGAFGLIAPLFPIFMINNIVGVSIEVIGISTAVFLLTKSLVQLVVSEIIEKIKGDTDDFYLEVVGVVISSLIYLLFPLIVTVPQLYLAHFILGVAAAMTYPTWMALFTRHSDGGIESKELGMHNILIDVVLALTAVIGAVVAGAFGFQFLFLIIGAIGMIGAFILLIMKNDLLKRKPKVNKYAILKDIEEYEDNNIEPKKEVVLKKIAGKRGRPPKKVFADTPVIKKVPGKRGRPSKKK